mgnify:FL=1
MPFVVLACEAQVETVHVSGQVPVRVRIRIAPEHADGDLQARKLRAFEFDRVDARDQADGLVRDQVAVEDAVDVARAAPAGIAVVVGDERTQISRIALLRCKLRRIDQRADLVFRRAGRTTTCEREYRGERQLTCAADKRPIAAGRP